MSKMERSNSPFVELVDSDPADVTETIPDPEDEIKEIAS
jgi:hypothetical protein